jgi:hypothetical protein
MHYLKARKANADLVKLIDLFVADKLKDCLSPGALQYVLSLEGDSCFTSNSVASNADIYCGNYNDAGAYKGCNLFNVPLVDKFDNRKKFLYGRQNDAKLAGGPNNSSDKNGNGSKSTGVVLSSGSTSNTDLQSAADIKNGSRPTKVFANKKLFFACHSDQHVVANCPGKVKKSSSATSVKASAHACVVDTAAGRANTQDCHLDTTAAECSACDVNYKFQAGIGSEINVTDSRQCELEPTRETVIGFVSTLTPNGATEVQLAPLNYVDVVIAGTCYKALVDSGAQVPLIRSELVRDMSFIGSINIQPVVGAPVLAKLAVLDIAKYDHSADAEVTDEHRPLHVVFAVTDLATHDVILPSSVVADLQRTSHKSSCQCVDSTLLPQCSLVTAAEQDSESLGKDDGKGEPTNVDLLNDDFQCTVSCY